MDRSSFLGAPARADLRKCNPDAGETLIEVLVTVIVVGLAVVALLGSLLVSTSSSITHRSVTNLDGILRTVAESARYEIQTRPQDGMNGPRFQPCAQQYPVISDPYPDTGIVGTTPVVVFATGFATIPPARNILTVTVGAQTLPPAAVSGATTDPAGNATLMFVPPTTGLISVALTATSLSATSRIPFQTGGSTPGVTAASLFPYKLTSTLTPIPSPCSQATSAQQVTLSLSNPTPGNGASSQLSFVVGNFSPQAVVLTANSDSANVPANLTFTASVTDFRGVQESTGTLAWSVIGPNGAVACSSQTAPPLGTCKINSTTVTFGQQGAYTATARYTQAGGGFPSGESGTTSINVLPATPQSAVSASATGGPLVLTDTVTGGNGLSPGANGSSVSWAIQANDGTTTFPTCDSTSGPANSGNFSTWTCTINTPDTTMSYTASPTYNPGGNPNYGQGFATGTFSIPVFSVVGTNSTDKLTFAESVSGGPAGYPAPTGTITWNIASTEPLFVQPCTMPTSVTGSNCKFNGLHTFQYSAQVTYAGDQNWASETSTSSNTVTAP